MYINDDVTLHRVPKDGDCFASCVRKHFELQGEADFNLRTQLWTLISSNFEAVIHLIKTNGKVASNLISWFTSLYVRPAISNIDAGSELIRQVEIPSELYEKKEKINEDIIMQFFETNYHLTLNEVVLLLREFVQLSAVEMKKKTDRYLNFDDAALNLWCNSIHLDLMVFFRIIDFGCIMSASSDERTFRVTSLCKGNGLTKLSQRKCLFVVHSGSHFNYLEILLNADRLSVFGGDSDDQEHSYEINSINPVVVGGNDFSFTNVTRSKFNHVVRLALGILHELLL